jgi:hypothetical protein
VQLQGDCAGGMFWPDGGVYLHTRSVGLDNPCPTLTLTAEVSAKAGPTDDMLQGQKFHLEQPIANHRPSFHQQPSPQCRQVCSGAIVSWCAQAIDRHSTTHRCQYGRGPERHHRRSRKGQDIVHRERFRGNSDFLQPKPCCVCLEQKAKRDECMLFSTSNDAQKECADLVGQYRQCMAGYGFKI